MLPLIYNKEIKYLRDEQNQIILGSLLGDAWMALSRKGNAMLRFKHQAKDLEYINWKYEKLKEFCVAEPKYKEYFDKRTQKTYSSYTFNTLSYHELTPYYQDFYLDKIKIIPNNLNLSSLTIAIWFCDDGFLRRKAKNAYEMQFATDCFSKSEVEFLIDLLNAKYSSNFYISTRTKNNHHTIYGSTKSAQSIIDDIKPIFPDGMKRKLQCLI
jgi:hypothetical protein